VVPDNGVQDESAYIGQRPRKEDSVSSAEPGRRAATIYSVAQRAGVSIATVSRVLQGTTSTSEGTRRKVMQAVEKRVDAWIEVDVIDRELQLLWPEE